MPELKGAEIAWRTLRRERVEEPCIIAAWMMKREFFRRYARVQDIYRNPVQNAVDAFANAGCNLNPQFIMPSPFHEHLACDPWNLPSSDSKFESRQEAVKGQSQCTPEQIRDEIEQLPDLSRSYRDFDIEGTARDYAERLLHLTGLSRDRTLYIGGFGMPSFMGGYTRWGYVPYLSALCLYPDHMRRFFHQAGERARLHNEAIAYAMKAYDIAPVVYGGDDICFNDGPICSVATLDDLYFPALERAIKPLVTAGIDIVWHCDGNVLPIVNRLVALGITGFQGFQEQEASIPLEEMVTYRRKDGGKLIFFGSISVVHTFPFGSPVDIRCEVERCFQVAAPEGGFCIAPTSSILPETPMENIVAFLEHSRRFGSRFLKEMWTG
jgi:hypothetical protein